MQLSNVPKSLLRQATFAFVLLTFFSCTPVSLNKTQHIAVPSGSRIDVGFSPSGSALNLILQGIQQSQKTILVATYSFTSKPISRALLNAYERGVHVAVIADKKANTPKYSAVNFLAKRGVPVKTNNNFQIFHHKFMVIDGLHVETGSFNYTAGAASKNAENALMLWNNKKVADVYTAEWNRLWDQSDYVEKEE